METLIEWQLTDHDWLQVTVDPSRAGTAMVNLAVDDLVRHRIEIEGRGIIPADPVEANKGVQLCPVDDPDGNTITFLGGFRIRY